MERICVCHCAGAQAVIELIPCNCSLSCHRDTQAAPGPRSEWETRYCTFSCSLSPHSATLDPRSFDLHRNVGKGLGGGRTGFNVEVSFTSRSPERALCPLCARGTAACQHFHLPFLGGLGQQFWAATEPARVRECRVSASIEKVVIPLPLPCRPFLEKGLPP